MKNAINSNNNNNSGSVAGNSINTSNMGFEDGNLQEIDEDLHSRQLAVQSDSHQSVLFLRFTSGKGGGGHCFTSMVFNP
ncbi:hypothetical protein LXL04_038798 [Taraxacum kok-saghyz]